MFPVLLLALPVVTTNCAVMALKKDQKLVTKAAAMLLVATVAAVLAQLKPAGVVPAQALLLVQQFVVTD
jgi:hypothetical protein